MKLPSNWAPSISSGSAAIGMSGIAEVLLKPWL